MALFCPMTSYAMTITSPFGWRIHPISGERSFHTGIDIAGDMGAPIPAVWEGQVTFAGWYGGYGNVVVLYHGGTTYTLYGHCSQIYVQVGQTVKQSDTIAAVGSTGNSTGPHVHLEYVKDGQYVDPMKIWE